MLFIRHSASHRYSERANAINYFLAFEDRGNFHVHRSSGFLAPSSAPTTVIAVNFYHPLNRKRSRIRIVGTRFATSDA